MSDPDHHDVRVRRSPRVGVFLVAGALLGALAALIAVGLAPPDPEVPTPQALGFLVALLAPVGALVGGAVAVLIDAVGERRARVVQAERIGSEPLEPELVEPEPVDVEPQPADRAEDDPRGAPGA